MIFELRKGGRRFQCRIDVATGRATLSISGQDMEQWRPTAPTNVRGTGRHDILFSNCDDELLLWVDGSVVAFDAPTTYDDLGNTQPDNDDLAPVGVASAGAQVQISHLRVLRDIYYSAVRGDGGPRESYDVRYQPGPCAAQSAASVPPRRSYVDFPLEAGPVLRAGRQQREEQGRAAVGARILGQPRVADRQGPVHLLAPFLGQDSVRQSFPFPIFPISTGWGW